MSVANPRHRASDKAERLRAAIDKLGGDVPVEFEATVDAQLAILRSVLAARDVERNWDTLVYTTDALALADAVVGYGAVPSEDSLREAAIEALRKDVMSNEDIHSGGLDAVLHLMAMGQVSIQEAAGILSDVCKGYNLRAPWFGVRS